MNDLNTVAGAANELKTREAAYEAKRNALLKDWQANRKRLKTLVACNLARDGPPADNGEELL